MRVANILSVLLGVFVGCHAIGDVSDATFGEEAGQGGAGAHGGSTGTAGETCNPPCPASSACVISDCVAGACALTKSLPDAKCTGISGYCTEEAVCVECTQQIHCGESDEICANNQCVPSGCENKTKDPTETDVDCGGPCGPCDNGDDCSTGGDCLSNVCNVDTCEPCVMQGDCDSMTYCNTTSGICVLKKGDGTACNADFECQAGDCVDGDGGKCCATSCGD